MDGIPPQVWTDTQTENITFGYPPDAGGNYGPDQIQTTVWYNQTASRDKLASQCELVGKVFAEGIMR